MPVETIFVPYLVLHPEKLLLSIFIATLGSMTGAVGGHFIGKSGGVRLISKIIKEEKIEKAVHFFDKYGTWAVAIAALTPLPYKIFTIISGILRMRRKDLMYVSFLSRGIRFIFVGVITVFYGQVLFENILKITVNQKITLIIILILLTYGYLVYKRYIGKKQ